MKKYYFVMLCTCLIVGCQSKTSEKLQVKKEYTFSLGKNVDRYHERLYYDKQKRKEFIYFSDAVTDKIIKVFDMQGNAVQAISLVPALKALQKIRDIQIIALDTILLNSHETNKIAIINREGKVWKEVWLESLLTDKKGNHFELWNFEALNSTGETLIFPCGWRYNQQDIAQNKEPKDNFERIRYFYRNEFFSPYFCKVSNLYGDKPMIEYGLYNFYGNMGTKENVFSELPSYDYENNTLFAYSTYSDTLYQIDTNTMRIQKKIKITSSHTPVYAKPLNNDNITLNNMQDLSNQIGRTEGYIYNVRYNANNKQYYVIVFHKIPLSTPKEQQGNGKRSFSVIIYDDAFQKINEYVLDNKNHNAWTLSGKEGVIFPRKNANNKNKKQNNETTFTIFDFEK